jgi:hypothetical protein
MGARKLPHSIGFYIQLLYSQAFSPVYKGEGIFGTTSDRFGNEGGCHVVFHLGTSPCKSHT